MPPALACSPRARTLAPRRRSSVTDGVLPQRGGDVRLARSPEIAPAIGAGSPGDAGQRSGLLKGCPMTAGKRTACASEAPPGFSARDGVTCFPNQHFVDSSWSGHGTDVPWFVSSWKATGITLCASTIKRAGGVAPCLCGRANLIFNARSSNSRHPGPARSTGRSTNNRAPLGESHWAALATGSPCVTGTARRKTPRTALPSWRTGFAPGPLSSGKVAQTVLYGCHWGISSYASPMFARLSRRS